MSEENTALAARPMRRRASYQALPASASPVPRQSGAVIFCCGVPWDDEPRHFLDACALCRKPLRASGEFYMYRGDIPFCSEECRQERIELDEAKEREAYARGRRWQRYRTAPSTAKSVREAVEAS